MKKRILIKGGATGFGLEIVKRFCIMGFEVHISARRLDKLQQAQAMFPQQIVIHQNDITNANERLALIQFFDGTHLDIIIHLASTLEPVGFLGELDEDDFKHAMATNVQAPLFLTQELLPVLDEDKETRVLLFSSKQAHHPQLRMAAYCATKAALYSIYQNLNVELQALNRSIYVGIAQPGIVQTESMYQVWLEKLGEQRIHELPQHIKSMFNQRLYQAEEVAQFMCALLLESTHDRFIEKEWDIRMDAGKFSLEHLL
jgi:NADP-dependent 3-hydroxy acid dehydrogenase YdfG